MFIKYILSTDITQSAKQSVDKSIASFSRVIGQKNRVNAFIR